jgi:hypothetical protein
MSDGKEQERQVTDVSVGAVLITVSDEVRMLSDSAGDLQNLIGNLIVAGAFGGSQSIYELQSLDRLCQNLGAVADFLRELSKCAQPGWTVDVASAATAVKLADLAERLTGHKTEIADETGEFENFGDWPMTG